MPGTKEAFSVSNLFVNWTAGLYPELKERYLKYKTTFRNHITWEVSVLFVLF